MKFYKIPEKTFSGLLTEAGILLNRFNPETGEAPKDEDIVCATTGGVNPSCVPTYQDYGEDVDNCPVNIKWYCLKLKDILQRAITRAKPPIYVMYCCFSFYLCANVVRQMCAKKRSVAW